MGERRIINGAIYERSADGTISLVGPAPAAASSAPTAIPLPVNPVRAAREAQEAARRERAEARAVEAAERAAAAAGRSADTADRTATTTERTAARQDSNDNASRIRGLSGDWNSDPTVKAFRVAMAQVGQALNTGEGAQADLALTYAFAKAMDPESVVRESEQGMITNSQPWFQSAVENIRKQYGADGAGNFTPETRDALRRQLLSAVQQRHAMYDERRRYYSEQAERLGLDPTAVVGREHDAAALAPAIEAFQARQRERHLAAGRNPDAPDFVDNDNDDVIDLGPIGEDASPAAPPSGTLATPGTYAASPAGQTLSGVNEGIANTFGAPVDIAASVLNLIPRGLNAITNSELPTIQDPVLGSDWLKDRMAGWGIHGQTNDPTLRFARRVGESAGGAIVPGAAAGSIPRAFATMAAGAGGGVGAATAQQIAPGNVWAEMGGELLGGVGAGYGLARRAQGAAQSTIEDAIPSTQDLRDQAGQLYRNAESRGVTATPDRTEDLADILRQTLTREGQLGPAGRITNADTNTSKALNLVEQYEGRPMRPTEMDAVRRVLADSRRSPDPSDQRLGGILLEQFDDWVRPLAPEFDDARAVASRYLQADDLEQARELAQVRSGQFTGSGYENALRTEYRGLDRNTVRGSQWFDPHVQQAVQNVSRGTPGSNFARAVGRFAVRGPVSAGAGLVGPAALGGAVGGPAGAVAFGAGAAGIGEAGRAAATRMGLRNAEIAELTARNGGAIPQAPLIPDVFRDQAARLAAIEYAKYLTERPDQQR